MNKSWLIIIIILAIATAVTLAFTWQNIPYLNDLVWDLNIGVKIEALKTQITSFTSNPTAVFGSLGGITAIGTLIYKAMNGRIQKLIQDKSQIIRDKDTQVGDLANVANEWKDKVTGLTEDKEGLQEQVTDLEGKLREQAETYANIDNVLQAKDDAIKKLRDQTDGLHDVIKNMKLGDGEIIERIVVA